MIDGTAVNGNENEVKLHQNGVNGITNGIEQNGLKHNGQAKEASALVMK